MTRLIAIDPGPTRSGWVILVNGRPESFGTDTNDDVLRLIRRTGAAVSTVVIEQVRSYGMAVGAEVFDTVHWCGRFHEAALPARVVQVPRLAVKLALCKSARATDSNLRQALLDRFGGKEAAVGRKAAPGPLYGLTGDAWAALAVGLTFEDGATNG